MVPSTGPSARIVGDLVVERPARARLFEQLGIDYCCEGGRRTLGEVCRERGLDAATVAVLLDTLESDRGLIGSDWGLASLGELCDHVVGVHHAYLRRELPHLSQLLEQCERAHGVERPELSEARATFDRLRAKLERHLAETERTLVSACRTVAARQPLEPGLLAGLERFAAEHTGTGALLQRLSALMDGYDTGAALCSTHRAAIAALAEFERDLREHLHEETNILFPRVLAPAQT